MLFYLSSSFRNSMDLFKADCMSFVANRLILTSFKGFFGSQIADICPTLFDDDVNSSELDTLIMSDDIVGEILLISQILFLIDFAETNF